jgi:flagellar protein FliJ
MFRFRFETLLRVRRSAEDLFQKELAEARRVLAAEQEMLRALRSTHRQCLHELHRIQQQGFRASDVQLYDAYRTRLDRDIDRQQKRMAGAERKMIQKRSALISAVKKRKVMEKLKDNEIQAHLGEMAANERKFMDDVATRMASKSIPVDEGSEDN